MVTRRKPDVSRRQSDLETMRTQLIAAALDAKPGDLPSITRELRAVIAELDQLTPSKTDGERVVDDLKARRARRTAS